MIRWADRREPSILCILLNSKLWLIVKSQELRFDSTWLWKRPTNFCRNKATIYVQRDDSMLHFFRARYGPLPINSVCTALSHIQIIYCIFRYMNKLYHAELPALWIKWVCASLCVSCLTNYWICFFELYWGLYLCKTNMASISRQAPASICICFSKTQISLAKYICFLKVHE